MSMLINKKYPRLIFHFFYFFLFMSHRLSFGASLPPDLTCIGPCMQSDGVGQIIIRTIEMLKDELEINVIKTHDHGLENGLDEKVKEILSKDFNQPGNVSLLIGHLATDGEKAYQKVPPSKIKLAHVLFDGTRLPSDWSPILNSSFDAVLVTDPFYVKVFEDAGVEIPIFVLPLPYSFHRFFQAEKRQKKRGEPFVFASAGFDIPKKNLSLIIKAFKSAFADSNKVLLKINSRWCTQYDPFASLPKVISWDTPKKCVCQQIVEMIGGSNVLFTRGALPERDYLDFMRSCDCYINISTIEGYSLAPREALAMKIPCIVSNNSAQKTICQSGLVRAVPSEILEPADNFKVWNGEDLGFFFNCTEEDVSAALIDVYLDYEYYTELAEDGPAWVAQYDLKNLKHLYMNLIKPQKIILGDANKIMDECLMTNSPLLYRKYVETFPSAIEK